MQSKTRRWAARFAVAISCTWLVGGIGSAQASFNPNNIHVNCQQYQSGYAGFQATSNGSGHFSWYLQGQLAGQWDNNPTFNVSSNPSQNNPKAVNDGPESPPSYDVFVEDAALTFSGNGENFFAGCE